MNKKICVKIITDSGLISLEDLDVNFLEELFDEVVKIAKEDNIITPDEQAIIIKTRENINKFKFLYGKAIEDNINTESEYKLLIHAYKKIYSGAESEALKDEKLTTDEVKIISKIAHTLFTP